MRLERCDLLRGVVVVDAQLEVIGTCYYPILPRDEATGAYGYIGELEGLDDGLRYVRPDVDVAAIQGREDPWLGWMKVNAFDTLRPREELPLYVQTHCCSLGVYVAEGWIMGTWL